MLLPSRWQILGALAMTFLHTTSRQAAAAAACARGVDCRRTRLATAASRENISGLFRIHVLRGNIAERRRNAARDPGDGTSINVEPPPYNSTPTSGAPPANGFSFSCRYRTFQNERTDVKNTSSFFNGQSTTGPDVVTGPSRSTTGGGDHLETGTLLEKE